MVEIFKTDVQEVSKANRVIEKLLQQFPSYRINFDLQDCDRILRVESCNGSIVINGVVEVAIKHNLEISAIAD